MQLRPGPRYPVHRLIIDLPDSTTLTQRIGLLVAGGHDLRGRPVGPTRLRMSRSDYLLGRRGIG